MSSKVVAVCSIIVSMIVLTGCSNPNEEAAPPPNRIPEVNVKCAPAEDGTRQTFQADTLVGLSLADAERLIDGTGCELRVKVIDGMVQVTDDDLRYHRIDVAVENEIVAAIVFPD